MGKLGMTATQGFLFRKHVILPEQITKENVSKLVTNIRKQEDVTKQYTIDENHLYQFLKTTYAPETKSNQVGGRKHRKKTKKEKTGKRVQ